MRSYSAVELGAIRALGEVQTSPLIIHLVAAQPPLLNAACQQRNISQCRTQDILSSTKGIYSSRARRNFTVSESLSCCLDNTGPTDFFRWKYLNDNLKLQLLAPLLSKPSNRLKAILRVQLGIPKTKFNHREMKGNLNRQLQIILWHLTWFFLFCAA